MAALVKKNRWDTVLGDLSYPIYLIHVPVIAAVGNGINGEWCNFLILAGSIMAAAIMVATIERPLESARQRWIRSRRDTAPSMPDGELTGHELRPRPQFPR